MKKAIILHQELQKGAAPDELDVLDQASAIEKSLKSLGYEVYTEPVSLNLEKLLKIIGSVKPDVVVNLVETLGGRGRLIHFVPGLLDSVSVPYTGSGQQALYITTGKTVAKKEMIRTGLPTPGFFGQSEIKKIIPGKKYILKPTWEDASVGITDKSVVTSDTCKQQLNLMLKTGIKEWLFEEYIDGREFNVTLLETKDGWRVFHPAEIVFKDFPKGKPKILGYESKWDETSFEYTNTNRTFETIPKDNKLILRLTDISLRCADVFNLGGYARVDFRVDQNNDPWVLEVNANPCLTEDAGFYAACRNEGMTYTEMVSAIIEAAFKRR
ncbi:MAG: D-alanine--D-alanine ligase family protein [Bacteroidales bacterium]